MFQKPDTDFSGQQYNEEVLLQYGNNSKFLNGVENTGSSIQEKYDSCRTTENGFSKAETGHINIFERQRRSRGKAVASKTGSVSVRRNVCGGRQNG